MRLFVAEKPSVARDLAHVLGATRRTQTRLEGPGVWVTWCIGHLVEHAAPAAHNPAWKRWSPANLPMLPPTLKLQPVKRTESQFKAVARMLNDRRVEQVINACDAGREGELIFRYLVALAGCAAPVQRFWVSSLTQSAIRAGLANLRPGAEFDGLAAAARCRAEADWLVGMNATRGMTAVGDTLLSVGRVQTPTLALIVGREKAIRDFVADTYWVIEAQVDTPKGSFVAQCTGPLDQPPAKETPERCAPREIAEGAARQLTGAEGEVLRAKRDQQRVPPPQLYHLTALQQAANRRFGMTADQTLKTAQALYERHKLITYPRTDSRHLTTDVAHLVPGIIQALGQHGYAAEVAGIGKLRPLTGRQVANAKVGDHHALLPTTRAPSGQLGRDEARIYDLICRRLLAQVSPDAIYARTHLVVGAAGLRLEARGRTRVEAGWEAVDPQRAAKKAAPLLPLVEPGDPARVEKADVLEKQTRPPPRFSEASLLGAMERAGRALDDPALRAAMREAGLGTPATRAGILETLLRRTYLKRSSKQLMPTTLGEALIDALPVPALASPELTGQWEQRLTAIADGEADPMAFRRDIRQFVRDAVAAMKAAPRVSIEGAPERGKRGRGGRASRRSPRASKASKSTKAAFRAPKAPARPAVAKSAAPKSAAPKSAAPKLAAPKSAAPRSKKAKVVSSGRPRCPACKQGEVITGSRGWGCSRHASGCPFVVWFEHSGVRIPDDEADRLFRRKQTRLFTQIDGQRARLVLDLGASGNVRWGFGKRR
ncbi:MAG: DNA topoisomerase-3 [Bradymonadia bacterium]|jgi:DNA topoisomerase-3